MMTDDESKDNVVDFLDQEFFVGKVDAEQAIDESIEDGFIFTLSDEKGNFLPFGRIFMFDYFYIPS